AVPTRPFPKSGYQRPGAPKGPSGPFHAQDVTSTATPCSSDDSLNSCATADTIQPSAAAQPSSKVQQSTWDTVQSGASFPPIAQRLGMTVETLAAANANVANGPLAAGQQIVIPIVDAAVVAQAPTKTFTPLPTNTVQPTSTPTDKPLAVAQVPTSVAM